MKSKKTVIYTAIFGGKDNLKDNLSFTPSCDFVCFTDNPSLKSNLYKVNLTEKFVDDPVRNARMYKMLPHIFLNEYDIVVWVDGSVVIKKDPLEFTRKSISGVGFATYKHQDRTSVYREAEECILVGKDEPQIIKAQMDYYQNDSFDGGSNLVETSVIMRDNFSSNTIKINEEWWKQLCTFSRRDQLSLNYVLWKFNLKINIIDQNVRDNEYFRVEKHKIGD